MAQLVIAGADLEAGEQAGSQRWPGGWGADLQRQCGVWGGDLEAGQRGQATVVARRLGW